MKHFPEKSSELHCTTWVPFDVISAGSAYKDEERLRNKRWELSSEIIGEGGRSSGVFQCIVLFHTPTNFVIEYLRVDIKSPISRKVTIIDGRRDMKEWVSDMDDNKINKKVYPKYRPDENIKY